MKVALAAAGLSLVLSACTPATLSALFSPCPVPAAAQQTEPAVITPEGRIMLPSSTLETEP